MAEDSANAENVYLSPRIVDLCSQMSKLSLQEHSLCIEAGDTPRSKVHLGAFGPAGKGGELDEPAMEAVEKAKVVDEAGDASRKDLLSDQSAAHEEFSEKIKETLVRDGTGNDDLRAGLQQHDLQAKPEGDQAIDDACEQPVRLADAAKQATAPEDVQARDQLDGVSNLVHVEPFKEDQPSHPSGIIAHLTSEEFARAPKYAKGTLSLDLVKKLVDDFNEALASKYRLLALPKSEVPKLQRGKVAAYRELETAETKQLRFLVEGDLTGKGGPFGSRRTAASFFMLMRHCGKIREIRGPGSIVRYAVNK